MWLGRTNVFIDLSIYSLDLSSRFLAISKAFFSNRLKRPEQRRVLCRGTNCRATPQGRCIMVAIAWDTESRAFFLGSPSLAASLLSPMQN